MDDTSQQLIEALDRRVERRNERRDFFKAALGAAAVAGAGAGAITLGSGVYAQTAPTDADVLNFALNLEYLEAQFYNIAVFGTALPDSALNGVSNTTSGARGAVSGGRKVTFQDPLVAQYAKEIALDEANHVTFLRTQLGSAAVAQPAIDIGTAPNGAFSSAARSAGIISGPDSSFDPYDGDINFLLGAFIFEDVGVTAYKGAAPLLTNKTYIEASAGLLAVEAYHASIIRTTLYRKGVDTPVARSYADLISNARDSLDGSDDRDQGISPTGSGATAQSNIAPLDGMGLAFSRTTGQVLNIVYLNPAAVGMGGFFPAGVNGAIRTSGANNTQAA